MDNQELLKLAEEKSAIKNKYKNINRSNLSEKKQRELFDMDLTFNLGLFKGLAGMYAYLEQSGIRNHYDNEMDYVATMLIPPAQFLMKHKNEAMELEPDKNIWIIIDHVLEGQ